MRNCERYGMRDDHVRFVKGWFSETLPGLCDRQWSAVRLDGDLYESTIVALDNLYPSLAPGGFLIIKVGASQRTRNLASDVRG